MDNYFDFFLGVGVLLAFSLGVRLFGIVLVCSAAINVARATTTTLLDSSMTDEQKELVARRASVVLWGKFVSIFLRTIGAVLLPTALISIVLATNISNYQHLILSLTSWPVLLVGGLCGTLLISL